MFRINQSGAICFEFGARLCKFMVISAGHPAESEEFRFREGERELNEPGTEEDSIKM